MFVYVFCVFVYVCMHVFECKGMDWYIDTSDFPMMATSSSQFPSVKLVYCLYSVHTTCTSHLPTS